MKVLRALMSLLLVGSMLWPPGSIHAATGCTYPASLDSWADKVANDFLTVADVNQRTCAIEKLESGPLQPNVGTAALPAYSFQGDADTGMYRSAANEISWSTNATQFLRLTSAGVLQSVGTGKISPPTAKDTVNKTTDFSTTSATMVNVTDLTVTITVGANRVLLLVSGTYRNATASIPIFQFHDGTSALGGMAANTTTDANNTMFAMHFLTAVQSAGAVTFTVQVRTSAGTLILEGTDAPLTFSAIEILGG